MVSQTKDEGERVASEQARSKPLRSHGHMTVANQC